MVAVTELPDGFPEGRFGIGPDLSPSQNAQGIQFAYNRAALAGRKTVNLPEGDILIEPFLGDVAVRLDFGVGIDIVGKGTRLIATRNDFEIFSMDGATDVTLTNIEFLNPSQPLQDQVKPPSLQKNGGVLGLGNVANCVIRQYSGDSLTIDDCILRDFTVGIHYIGDDLDNEKVSGDLKVVKTNFYNCAMRILVDSPETFVADEIQDEDGIDSLLDGGAKDPGHMVYVTDRSGAAPVSVRVTNFTSLNASSSPVKVRKGLNPLISGFTLHNCRRGIELANCKGGVISSGVITLGAGDGLWTSSNDSAIEITDCGHTLVDDDVSIDISGYNAWAVRMRKGNPLADWANVGNTVNKIGVTYDNAGTTGKSLYIISEQKFGSLSLKAIHEGDIASTRYPIMFVNSSENEVLDITRVNTGAPGDEEKTVSLDAQSHNNFVFVGRKDLSGVQDLGSGNILKNYA